MRNYMAAATILLCACAHAATAQVEQPGTPQDTSQKALVPPGYGSLKQDEFTMGMRSGALLVKVTPLDESVIRMAAPDTYTRLHALATSRTPIASQRTGSDDPELFLVSFFSYQPDVVFNPEDVQFEYHGRLMRSSTIIPLTPGWGKQRMDQQETQAAIYAFPDPFDFQQDITVHYGADQTSWQSMIPKLEVERTKILSRIPK